MGKHKEIVRNQTYLKEVKEFIKKGGDITSATRKLCAKHKLDFTDSLRRAWSRKLAKIGDSEIPSKQVPIEHTDEYKEAVNRELPKSKYVLVTWAQAESQIDERLWENMNAYADHIGATILVSCGRYKNPLSLEQSDNLKDKEKNKNLWHPSLKNNLFASRVKINKSLSVLSDVKVMPTATTPLTGLNGFTGMESAILPHPKQHLQSVPVLESYPHKLLVSTGAITLPNYTDTKAGKKGEFHHHMGFVIVEIETEEKFHIRQVQAEEDGSFYDLWFRVQQNEVIDVRKTKEDLVYNMVWGDLHAVNRCQKSVELAIDLANEVRAENIVLHDLFDGQSVNHHEEKDPFKLLKKEEEGLHNLENEITETLNFVGYLKNKLEWSRLCSVSSNHNDFLDRHLRNVDWRKVPNKRMYLKLANIVADGKAPRGIFHYLLEQEFKERVDGRWDVKYELLTFGYGESLRIQDWECGLHGDYGAHSSRGGINQFKNLSTKIITGHSHSPCRQDGAIVVGTLTKLRLGYNTGLSAWVQGVVIIYPNKKASNVHFIDGSYTTLK